MRAMAAGRHSLSASFLLGLVVIGLLSHLVIHTYATQLASAGKLWLAMARLPSARVQGGTTATSAATSRCSARSL